MFVPVGPWLTINPGNPVRATFTRDDGQPVGAPYKVHAILFQQCVGNLDVIYVFHRSNGDRLGITSGTCFQIAAPSYNPSGKAIILPSGQVGIPGAPDPFNVANFWIDGDHVGDHCAVSVVIW